MKKFGDYICKNKYIVIVISLVLLVLSLIGIKMTKINYDILVYLPNNIDTIKGQNILTNDFNMGSYSITIIDNMESKDIINLEEKIRSIKGVNKVVSLYDVIGTNIPIEMFPEEIKSKVHDGNSDLLFITFNDSTSAENTIDAVKEIRKVTLNSALMGGMSSMVLDTMNLSNSEIAIYIVIAVILCVLVLELSLDSYIIPFILLGNIGFAILLNLGTNIFLGQISYITKALVAILQLGVTTDFSIFLYHSYEENKKTNKSKEEAMSNAIRETFTSVIGSSFTTIAGFLVLCTMKLTLGSDLGIVMAKGVLLGVITVLTLFPSLLLVFDKVIDKTGHKNFIPDFNAINKFIVKHNKIIFAIFILLIIPAYLANSKIDVYYKMDKTLPDSLESIKANEELKTKFNIVSPEMILIDKNIKVNEVKEMVDKLDKVEGIDFVLSFADIKEIGLNEELLDSDLINMFESDKYQLLLLNSNYDIASGKLNNQIDVINNIVKEYDSNALVAGEGPLMKDLIKISDTDFNNVNYSSVICIFIILFIVLKSVSLPFLLIASIEFAILLNMGVSYFSGVTLPFVAPIVLGTIQLGATIDYAILMTTNYLEKRKNGLVKKEAMLETMNYCGKSVFVSGMCFFASTFGVGVYSDLEMVGSLCTLISRGAIISMIVVITVLPSILLIFDSLIMKTTKLKRRVNMKKNINKFASYLVICGLLTTCLPFNVLALDKNETVYSKLNYDGSVKKILVNEQLINNNKLDSLEDYSSLENIINVNDNSTFAINNNKIVWNAKGNDIFYQGTTNKELPIKMNITYKLNNEEKSIDDIIGQEGHITITLNYENQDKHIVYINGKREVIYTPFIVTMGTIIDSKNNSNINITNGKVVSNGTKNTLVAIAAPGLYESLDLNEFKDTNKIVISYDTTKFELSSLYSVVTSKLISQDDLKTFDKMNNLYNNMDLLESNMKIINTGASKLKDGTSTLKNSLAVSIDSLKNNKDNALFNNQLEIIKKKTLQNINNTFNDEYKKQIADNTWKEVKNNLTGNDSNAVKIVTNAVSSSVVEYLKSVNEYQDYVNCEIGKGILAQGGSMSNEQIESCSIIQNDKTLPYVTKAVTTSSQLVASDITGYVAEKVSKEVAINVSSKTAIEIGSNVSMSVASEVANQVKNASIESVVSSLTKLYGGVEQIDNGTSDLVLGLTKFDEEGITKLYNVVNNDIKGMTDKVKALTNLSNNYKSFTNNNNDINGESKFILIVDSKSAPKNTIKEVDKVEKVSFLQRIVNLFK